MVMVGVFCVGMAMLHMVGIRVVSFVGQIATGYLVHLEVLSGLKVRV